MHNIKPVVLFILKYSFMALSFQIAQQSLSSIYLQNVSFSSTEMPHVPLLSLETHYTVFPVNLTGLVTLNYIEPHSIWVSFFLFFFWWLNHPIWNNTLKIIQILTYVKTSISLRQIIFHYVHRIIHIHSHSLHQIVSL